MPKIHRLRAPSYPVGVLPDVVEVLVEAEASAEVPGSPPAPPAASARIGAWRDYANQLGVNTAGMSKAQIRKKVGG